MDTTVRNLDEHVYRAIRARAVLEGKTVGEMITEAIRSYLAGRPLRNQSSSLRALVPEPYPDGNDHLSAEIDSVVYGKES